MDKQRRKELQNQYKEMPTHMGVVQITNEKNGKIFIIGYTNLKNKWLTLRMQLDMGRFANAALQADWRALGAENFTYSVLEEKDTKDMADVRWETEEMKKKWLEALQPYDEKGYNSRE